VLAAPGHAEHLPACGHNLQVHQHASTARFRLSCCYSTTTA
jgi:hypothetical protein